MRILVGLLIALAVAALADPATTQADDEIVRRTFDNADQLLREGKTDQALRDFEQVYTAWPDSSLADDALYRAATYWYPAESMNAATSSGAGAATAASLQKARDLLLRIKTKYPTGDQAPRALLKLGYIALDPANPQRSLDEAYAAFSGVVNIHPGSAELDRALLGAGMADFLAGRYDKSIASFQRLAEELPRSPVADDALFQAGLAFVSQGTWVRALEEFQSVRDLNPAGPLAGRALDRLTQVFKMKVQSGLSGRPLFVQDKSYAPALPPDAARGDTSLAVDPDNGLRLLDTRTGALLRLDQAGKVVASEPPQAGTMSVSVDGSGADILAAGIRVKAGAEMISPGRMENGVLRPIEKISAAVRVGFGSIAMLDEERNEVLLYEGDPAKLKSLYRDATGRARLTGLALGTQGRLYTIDRRGRKIVEITPGGASREIAPAAGTGAAMEEPVAVAADDLGDLYVLDRRAGAVVVMTLEGKPVARIASETGTAGDFSSATALAVGPRAEIYVHDAKRRTLLRFW